MDFLVVSISAYTLVWEDCFLYPSEHFPLCITSLSRKLYRVSLITILGLRLGNLEPKVQVLLCWGLQILSNVCIGHQACWLGTKQQFQSLIAVIYRICSLEEVVTCCKSNACNLLTKLLDVQHLLLYCYRGIRSAILSTCFEVGQFRTLRGKSIVNCHVLCSSFVLLQCEFQILINFNPFVDILTQTFSFYFPLFLFFLYIKLVRLVFQILSTLL